MHFCYTEIFATESHRWFHNVIWSKDGLFSQIGGWSSVRFQSLYNMLLLLSIILNIIIIIFIIYCYFMIFIFIIYAPYYGYTVERTTINHTPSFNHGTYSVMLLVFYSEMILASTKLYLMTFFYTRYRLPSDMFSEYLG